MKEFLASERMETNGKFWSLIHSSMFNVFRMSKCITEFAFEIFIHLHFAHFHFSPFPNFSGILPKFIPLTKSGGILVKMSRQANENKNLHSDDVKLRKDGIAFTVTFRIFLITQIHGRKRARRENKRRRKMRKKNDSQSMSDGKNPKQKDYVTAQEIWNVILVDVRFAVSLHAYNNQTDCYPNYETIVFLVSCFLCLLCVCFILFFFASLVHVHLCGAGFELVHAFFTEIQVEGSVYSVTISSSSLPQFIFFFLIRKSLVSSFTFSFNYYYHYTRYEKK